MGIDTRGNSLTPVSVTAYAVIPEDDVQFSHAASRTDGEIIPVSVTTTVASLCHPACGTIHPEFRNIIPEANGLAWTDTFFDDEDDVVAVFDFAYDDIELYYSKLGWCIFGSTCLCSGIFWTGVVLGVPCFLNKNVSWSVRNQHVAITRNGVLFVNAERPSCWGLRCTNIPKSSVLIPFDAITGCKVIEASGTACLCIDNTLHNVVVETKSLVETLKIEGLKNPEGFRKLVVAMKSIFGSAPPRAAATRVSEIMDRAAVQEGSATNDTTTLLREIRDELRQHNELLQSVRLPAQTNPLPSAPIAEARDLV